MARSNDRRIQCVAVCQKKLNDPLSAYGACCRTVRTASWIIKLQPFGTDRGGIGMDLRGRERGKPFTSCRWPDCAPKRGIVSQNGCGDRLIDAWQASLQSSCAAILHS